VNKRLLRPRRSRSSSSYSSGRRSRSSGGRRTRVVRGSRSRSSVRVRVRGGRSNYYRGSAVIIKFSKPTSALCYINHDCRSRCCKKNKVVKRLISPSKKVYNRYYGKTKNIKRYKKSYRGTATVKYVNGRKITRWNVRDRICQARRKMCPFVRSRVYINDEGGSGGIIGAIFGVIFCCLIICCIVWCCCCKNKGGGGHHDTVYVEDGGSYHSGGHDVDIHVDDYSHHSGGGGDYGGSHHDDGGGDYGDDGGHDDGGGDGGDY